MLPYEMYIYVSIYLWCHERVLLPLYKLQICDVLNFVIIIFIIILIFWDTNLFQFDFQS